MKRFNEYMQIAILLSIILSSVMVQVKLDTIREVIHDAKTPKLEISNSAQFSKLCQQLTTQWNGDGYAFYLLQPKSSIKTHKEKAGSSLNYDYLPVRLELSNKTFKEQLIRMNYIVGNNLDGKELFNIHDFQCKQFLVIPVYQNTIIIGELYVFYNNQTDFHGISTKVAEAQMLSKLFT